MAAHKAGRLSGFGTSIFTEMSRLALEHQAVNLGQGFPDFAAPDFVKQAACEAIAADHNQSIDLACEQIAHGLEPPGARAKAIAAGGANHGAAFVQNAADRIPVHRRDAGTPFDHALIAFVNAIDFSTGVERGAYRRAQRRIHTRCVAATGEDCNSFHDEE